MFDIYTVKFIKNIIEKSCFYMLTQQYFQMTKFIIFMINNKILKKKSKSDLAYFKYKC